MILLHPLLEIKNLKASIDSKPILTGVDLTVNQGEIHAIMGPNGSGKSTLSRVIMGDPKYKIDEGEIYFKGQLINDIPVDARAKLGLFLSFQYPMEIPGVSLSNFLRTAYNSTRPKEQALSVFKFDELLKEKLSILNMSQDFASRYLNDGFSGGEKKRCEIAQMAVLNPILSILDETDSGLDVDALKVVAEGAYTLSKSTNMSLLLITHYQRILRYIKPDFVHVFIGGKIVKSAREELAFELENKGYAQYMPKTNSKLKLTQV